MDALSSLKNIREKEYNGEEGRTEQRRGRQRRGGKNRAEARERKVGS